MFWSVQVRSHSPYPLSRRSMRRMPISNSISISPEMQKLSAPRPATHPGTRVWVLPQRNNRAPVPDAAFRHREDGWPNAAGRWMSGEDAAAVPPPPAGRRRHHDGSDGESGNTKAACLVSFLGSGLGDDKHVVDCFRPGPTATTDPACQFRSEEGYQDEAPRCQHPLERRLFSNFGSVADLTSARCRRNRVVSPASKSLCPGSRD